MYSSRSPNTSRNQRSKGVKGKHVLQICLLVAVCFWLLYQVKHSHAKKRELDENDSSLVLETHNDGDIPKLGRKDIPRVRETVTDDKLHEEDVEENEAVGEENRHEEGEQERTERTDDREEEEDTGRGGGDDEIDKHEEEKIDIDDVNHEEAIVDEENGREEGDEQNDDGSRKEDTEEIEMVLEDQDQDGEARNTHQEDNEESEAVLEDQDHDREAENTNEAREELYKADDASSEVGHDTKVIFPGAENTTLKSELISDGKENASHSSDESSSENSTTLKEFNGQSQTSNNSTQFESEHSIDMTQAQNATYGDGNNEGSNNSTSLVSSADVSDLASGKNQSDVKIDMTDAHHVNTTSEGSLSSSGELKSALAENITVAVVTKVDVVNSTNAGTVKDVDSDSENVAAEENESSITDNENENENAGVDLHDPIDDLDSSLTQEEKEYRTDLGTLPDIKLEVENADEVEAE